MLKKIFTSKVKGYMVSNAIGITIIAITKYLIDSNGPPIIIFSEFVIIPLLMGIISAWFWQDLQLPSRKLLLYSAYNCLLAILLSYVFLGEGIICLIIVSPLIFCFVISGAFIGRGLYKRNNDKLNVSVVLALAFVFIGDAFFSNHQYENEVSDTITVHAAPGKIWKNVVSFKRIEQKNTFWLFKIGMPSPIESTVEGNYVGAGRKCIFSNGYVFDERIATYEPRKDLTFDIVNQPKDPEIMNHIDIIRGQFILKDNGDGTTPLIGNSWYKLYVFPVWYYDIWAQSITRNVHLR
ncbi:hypothetical protein, partial [uncultured Mucilaginibacter sp.]|uniref:hypothetical protein n=1 Tax=uncultured Mucilaginibacter sp. TaxID=797541 RepID=UPI0025D73B4F